MDGFLRKLIAGSGITLISLLFVKTMAIVNSVICARLLTPADYGAFSIIVNLQNLAVIVACFGIPLALIKHISHYERSQRDLARALGSALMLMLVVSSVLTAIGYFVLSYTIAADIYDDTGLVSVLRLSSLIVFVSSVNLGLSALLQGCQKITGLATVNVIVAAVAQPVAFASIGVLGLDGAILSLVISNLLSVALLGYLTMKAFPISIKSAKAVLGEKERIRSLVAFTVPAFASGIVIVVAGWIGRTMLALEWDFTSVGHFQIADSLSQTVLVFSAAMSIPLLPMISELHSKDPSKAARDSAGLLSITVFLAIPLSFLILPLIPPVISVLYGADYQLAHVVTVIMFCAATYKLMSTVISNVILGMGRVWDALLLNLTWLGGFLVLMYVMVGENGSNGLAAAFTISFAGQHLLLLAYFWREFRIPVLRIAAVCTAYGPAVLIYVRYIAERSILERVAAACLLAATFATVSYFFVLGKTDRNSLRSMSWMALGRK